MEVAVLNIQGKETGRKITLDASVFEIEPNEHAIYLEVKQYLAGQRQGTHKAKERNEIAGSTRKIKKQKGTGTARAGSIKSPTIKGGGRVFGPRPRSYDIKLNKSVKRLAKRSIFSQKAKENQIKVLEDFNFETPKTKDFTQILVALGFENKKTLFVLAESNKNVYLSARNLPKTKVVTVSELNSFDLANASEIVLIEGSVAKIQENLTK